jgi:oligopeptide transport system ATP-binding protein
VLATHLVDVSNIAMENAILRVEHVKKYFEIKRGFLLDHNHKVVKAVDDVSFEVRKGETFSLVGESGSGKSTLGNTIIKIYEPTGGNIFFKDINLSTIKRNELHRVRREIQMVFQDPYSSLNPRMKIGDIVGEPIIVQKLAYGKEIKKQVDRYPHEFSGGQRQRIGIARALALQPELIICDEPISALDVSIRAQVINLLDDLQKQYNLTYIFIAHDLTVVRHISTRIAVMYLGKFAEVGDCEDVFTNPLHPYSQALLSAVPIPDPDYEKQRNRIILLGEIPDPSNPPSGCRFRTRCPIAAKICVNDEPELRELEPRHNVACHFA